MSYILLQGLCGWDGTCPRKLVPRAPSNTKLSYKVSHYGAIEFQICGEYITQTMGQHHRLNFTFQIKLGGAKDF